MNKEPFLSVSPHKSVILIDLVETQTPEASQAFIARTTPLAQEVGGRVVIANKAIAPMIVPDENAEDSDGAIRLLMVTHYPTKQAAQLSLKKRQDLGTEFSNDPIRTYVAQSAGRIQSFIGRTLPYTVGLWKRRPVPKTTDTQSLEALIDDALVLGEQPDKSRWMKLAERAGDRPIWMLNFLDFQKTARYADDPLSAAPAAPISGAHAYRLYGNGMMSSLAAVGGRVGWAGRALGQLAGRDDGHWHQVAIAVYPSPAAMMTMLALPKYRAAHIHRAAALARTRLLATQPL